MTDATQRIKGDWGNYLAAQGYDMQGSDSIHEADLTEKVLGSVVFWKKPLIDGIVIRQSTKEHPSFNMIYTEAFAIGAAASNFDIPYQEERKLSVSGKTFDVKMYQGFRFLRNLELMAEEASERLVANS